MSYSIPWERVPITARSLPARRSTPVGAAILGVLGEILITLGVLLGLYVVWELFWTDVSAGVEAQSAASAFEHRPAYVPPPPRDAPISEIGIAPQYRDNWPEDVAVGEDLSAPFAKLRVPRWGPAYVVPIREGVDRVSILNHGLIGHYEETALPGQIGNFASAAHRTTYGKPYAGVAELQDGDALIVETDQYWFVYRVTGREIIDPREFEVIFPVPRQPDAVPTERLITLTTCHPKFSAAQRYVIYGEIDYWSPKTDGGQLAELAEEG